MGCLDIPPGYFLVHTIHSNSLNSTMTVTTLLKGVLYSMECVDILSSGAGCVTLHFSKAGHLVQQCLCLSLIIGLFSVSFFLNFCTKTLIYQTQAAGLVGQGSGWQKLDVFHFFSSYSTFVPPGHVVPDCQVLK